MTENTPTPDRKKLSEEHIRKMYEFYETCGSIKKVADHFDHSKSTVHKSFKSLGLYVPKRAKKEITKERAEEIYRYYLQIKGSIKKTAKHFQYSERRLRTLLFGTFGFKAMKPFERSCRAYSMEFVQTMHRYYMENGYKATSLKFDVSVSALHAAFKIRGLKTNRK